MKRKGAFLLLLMTMVVLLSSCWSKKELTDLAIVSAVGIDKTKDGYHLTFQIINPGNVAGGIQGGGGGSLSPPITIYSA
ncbi:Ger(x)C family spore germination protein, partial [Priestia megaterium]|nr:Ger(x)C family spore germination protein [Priestia megaterium]